MTAAGLVRAEWTKFRTVRGWLIGMVVAALLIVFLGWLAAEGSHSSCGGPATGCPIDPVGPGGQGVVDRFYFVHRTLPGDGSMTVRVNSMTGEARAADAVPGVRNVIPELEPWSKAGIMVKDGTRQGATYAAIMMTGKHGVRMQYDFTHDVAGRPGNGPRWLRLTRSGQTLTGYESTDGSQWSKVGTVHLAKLPATAQIGLFASSPGAITVTKGDFGGASSTMRFSQATAVVDQISVQGQTSAAWAKDDIGVEKEADGTPHHPGGLAQSGGTFTITGVGDIAPRIEGMSISNTLMGATLGLIAVIVIAAGFMTAEYRRGLIRATFMAEPRRVRPLLAKTAVIAGVSLVAGLIAAAVIVPLASHILRQNGNYILPVSTFTEARVIVGTAALLAAVAVIALALGSIFRRSAAAITACVALIVLPHILATTSVLPSGVAQWMMRLTPAAGFSVQQAIPSYHQVVGNYVPQEGFYPLSPLAGFAVTCAYAVLALGLAAYMLRRRDA
ncbi:ABC transporter permease subunit [Actinomadura barringtoniae]|uniref:ABC transporter permease subunit n=1 Tax=Actinomadura barringtoniae TaxID=1427535 RepID=A0A939P9Z4_9ACTN|nr:ABC transporter permease subunit [Actinomadura barringtoniae]MBO2446103.1 ABC transporter permease subunit [Actinomadura barringtoniae]